MPAVTHPEAGFFCETARTDETVPSPFADDATRNMATMIYYLLTPDSPQGKMHMNKSITYHLLHQGRAKYTLIRPSPAGSSDTAPEIKHVVMGHDSERGEVRQLVVEGGWWKASEIPEEDLQEGEAGDERDRTGCLITRTVSYRPDTRSARASNSRICQVVVPGFDFEDHQFLTKRGLVELFHGNASLPEVRDLLRYTQEP
ncbi:hypothetical protein JCM8202_003490 [Rhodotorula sphaerocarpa]